ncbi:DUF3109 family protein [Cryomorphaceae bacterium 1068]|nr:DUF3109 family protein [Cryomorphaceae bacterium 1068]
MIQIDNALLSEDLFSKKFVCDLSACKGACCVEGDSGAPLEAEEVSMLEDALEDIKPYMRQEGIDRVEETGVFTIDVDGEYVTPLVNDEECAFVSFDDNGTAKCSIEQAHREGKTDFLKPISCHLYPIRLTQLKDYIALNYHHWPICDPARSCGAKLDVKVFRFLKEPITRKFGREFFDKLVEADKLMESSSK